MLTKDENVTRTEDMLRKAIPTAPKQSVQKQQDFLLKSLEPGTVRCFPGTPPVYIRQRVRLRKPKTLAELKSGAQFAAFYMLTRKTTISGRVQWLPAGYYEFTTSADIG